MGRQGASWSQNSPKWAHLEARGLPFYAQWITHCLFSGIEKDNLSGHLIKAPPISHIAPLRRNQCGFTTVQPVWSHRILYSEEPHTWFSDLLSLSWNFSNTFFELVNFSEIMEYVNEQRNCMQCVHHCFLSHLHIAFIMSHKHGISVEPWHVNSLRINQNMLWRKATMFLETQMTRKSYHILFFFFYSCYF